MVTEMGKRKKYAPYGSRAALKYICLKVYVIASRFTQARVVEEIN